MLPVSYCCCGCYPSRSAALCVRMNNVTMVIPTEREVNYHVFMYTMYSSNAASLRQLASFMRTDLGFKQLEVCGSMALPALGQSFRSLEHCMLPLAMNNV